MAPIIPVGIPVECPVFPAFYAGFPLIESFLVQLYIPF